ncbi:MAG: DNRLRE domain-containing protein, partial [Pseudonocardiales bacterium]
MVLTLLLPGALVTTGARADAASLKVSEDSYTSQSNAAATHGTSTYLGTNAAVSSERRAYLKFAVADIPVGATNVTAKLSVYAESSSSGTFTVYNIPSTWTESSLTWSNQPAPGLTVTQKVGVSTGYNDLDVSSAVKANGTYSFVIRNSAASQSNFTAKEAASNHPAQLLVNWTPPTSGDPVLGAAGDIACAPGGAVTTAACQQSATAALLAGNDVTVVQTLGDEQYESGASAEFTGGYDR